VQVTDSGPGIPLTDQEHVFERFFRGDRSRRRAAGAGLGLSIAKCIAEAHGGSLRLERSDASGTTFAVVLLGAAFPPELAVDVVERRAVPRT
jgi:signal transduction histidine kinase